jgi:hypothetical protein
MLHHDGLGLASAPGRTAAENLDQDAKDLRV